MTHEGYIDIYIFYCQLFTIVCFAKIYHSSIIYPQFNFFKQHVLYYIIIDNVKYCHLIKDRDEEMSLYLKEFGEYICTIYLIRLFPAFHLAIF